MKNEKIFSIKKDCADTILRSGKSCDFVFNTGKMCLSDKHCLYVTCEDRKFYRFKHETPNDKLYMLIDDSLDTAHAEQDTFCLDMSCDAPKPFPKRAAYHLEWQSKGTNHPHGDNWRLGIHAKAENLQIESNGYLRFRMEKWLSRPGVAPGLTAREPDETVLIDIAPGTYDYQAFEKMVTVSDDTACLLFTLEGEQYQGNVYFERPAFVSSAGENLLPDFDMAIVGVECYAWCGQNLSKREWPHFEIALNGKSFYDDEIFLRLPRYSPVQFEIPENLIKEGENTLTITYKSNYHDTLPIAIREISVLETPNTPFSVLFCPDIVIAQKPLHILLETQEENVTLALESDDFENIFSLTLKEAGLHVLTLKPLRENNHLSFTLSYKEQKEVCTVARTVYRKEDHVVCGSGDMIYIDNADEKSVKDYLAWFISNELGDLLTIRPVYHWGGHRTFNPKVWELVTKICNDMDMSYVLMSDGRDLPGINKNPSVKDLDGKGFLGRQVHERDGQLFYWGSVYPRDTQATTNAFFDLAMREFREEPEHGEGNYDPDNIMQRDGITSFRRDLIPEADMQVAHDTVAPEIRHYTKDFPRHTGPAITFKYFYEQGFEWLGAETMDTSMEPSLAFLRGASNAYGKTRTGVHHALQWSTFPHDTEKRYRRFLLANYISYMHGVTDINTEEGFWFMESCLAYHNRLSDACAQHRKMQKRFQRYVKTHSRTGTFYTKTAFLHGRFDGWVGLGRTAWGAVNLPIGEAEESWTLLKAFYPLNKIFGHGMGSTGYIPADHDKPFGCYSGTPRGNVDVIPVENGKFSDYSLLCFAGYNKAEEADFDGLLTYVKNGGTLVAAWPHLSETTAKADIDKKNHSILKHELTAMLSDGYPVFEKDTIGGKEILVCSNLPKDIRVLEKTDNGNPLVFSVPCGNGLLYLLNALSYPGDEAVYDKYKALIETLHDNMMEAEASVLCCGEDVEYTAYKQENGDMHYYITPVDWYNDGTHARKAVLKIGENSYPISIPFGVITKVIVHQDIAAWTDGMDAEVLSLDMQKILVQGGEDTVLHIAHGGKIKDEVLVFGDSATITLDVL